MSGVNSCHFVGNLTRDPDIRHSKDGNPIANFSIACNEPWGGEDHVEFINIVAFKKLAEIVEKYLRKGKQVYVQGTFKTSSWEVDGAKKYKTEIVARQMTMLGSKSDLPQSNNEPDDIPDF